MTKIERRVWTVLVGISLVVGAFVVYAPMRLVALGLQPSLYALLVLVIIVAATVRFAYSRRSEG